MWAGWTPFTQLNVAFETCELSNTSKWKLGSKCDTIVAIETVYEATKYLEATTSALHYCPNTKSHHSQEFLFIL